MKVYLIQHGRAFLESVDKSRSLTPEGIETTERVAVFLKDKIEVDCIWHSPKLRAVQTAEILNRYFPGTVKESKEFLTPHGSVDTAAVQINNFAKNLIIVGHLPFLHKLVSFLITGSDRYDLISFTNSGVVCMEYTGIWKIEWAIVPSLV